MMLESTFNYPLTGYTSGWHEPGLFNDFDCEAIIGLAISFLFRRLPPGPWVQSSFSCLHDPQVQVYWAPDQ